ncbi:unnamed protein product, partial [Durusdinium trenchii]
KVWVAFYAFRRDMGAKAFRDVLETRIFLNPENNGTCADSYLVGTSGFCFGLPPSSNFVNGPAIDPPLLPKILDGAPDWPPVPDPRYAPEPAKEWPDLTWLLYLVCSLAVVALLLGAFLLRRRRRLEEARRLNDAQEVEIGGELSVRSRHVTRLGLLWTAVEFYKILRDEPKDALPGWQVLVVGLLIPLAGLHVTYLSVLSLMMGCKHRFLFISTLAESVLESAVSAFVQTYARDVQGSEPTGANRLRRPASIDAPTHTGPNRPTPTSNWYQVLDRKMECPGLG